MNNQNRRSTDIEANKRNDLFKLRLILVSALLIAFGVYVGVTIEKRNVEHLEKIRKEYSAGIWGAR